MAAPSHEQIIQDNEGGEQYQPEMDDTDQMMPDMNQQQPMIPDQVIQAEQMGQSDMDGMGDDGQQIMQFSPEEIENLKEIFFLFDKEKQGSIKLTDLEAIMQSLQRDPEEAKTLLSQIRQNEGIDMSSENISFEEFIKLMEQVENKLAKDDPNNLNRQDFIRQSSTNGVINISADNKVLDFLRLLEEYRKKCEIEGNYQEAKKARGKFDELLRKETIRQKNNIRAAQEQEL